MGYVLSVEFPYALPCIVAAFLCVLTFIMAYFCLNETLVIKPMKTSDEMIEMDDLAIENESNALLPTISESSGKEDPQ